MIIATCEICSADYVKRQQSYTCSKTCSKIRYKKYQKLHYEKDLTKNRAARKEYSKNFRETRPEKRMLSAAKERANSAGIPFNLEVSDIVFPNVCPILGVPLTYGTRHAASLDRIVPALGYVKGNVQVISRKANVMKNDATPEELRSFALWVQKTYQH